MAQKLSVVHAESSTPVGQALGASAEGDIPGGLSTTATLAVGGSLVENIEVSGDQDWFQVNLVAGQRYVFTLTGTGLDPLDDPYLEVMDASGNQVRFNDDANGNTLDSTVYFTPNTSGTYYLNAHGWVNPDDNTTSTGQYTLTAAEAPPIPEYTFDAIADYLTDGYWSHRAWSDLSLTYDVQNLTTDQANLARTALAVWASVSGLTFTEVTTDAQLVFNSDPDPDDPTAQSAYTTSTVAGGVITHSEINITDNWYGGDTTLDSYTFQTYLHEIGHALGLGHSGPYNGDATYGQDNIYSNDNWSYTVMSYFDQLDAGFGNYRFVLGPQIADILAIQDLYGTNPTGTRSGNTTYGFNSTESDINDWSQFVLNEAEGTYLRPPSYAIYDTGGIDTIDLSGFSRDQLLSLVQETFSSVGYRPINSNPTYTNIISIARGTIIENAIGGSGNDTIIGNFANNILRGGDGNDTLYGYGGADFLDGGNGNDTINGGAQIDTLVGRAGDDTLNGGDGSDTLYGGDDNDILNGDAGADFLDGGLGNDTLSGGLGEDIIVGRFGNDILNGGDGADTLYGSSGSDTLNGNAGNDILDGGDGADVIYGNEGSDTLYGRFGNDTLNGGVGADFIYGNSGADILIGGDGNDSLDGGDGADTLDGDAGADTLTGGNGNDIVRGGDDNDTLNGDAGADFLDGGNGNDTINGGAQIDTLVGRAGDDTLNGGDGSDTLYGGDDNDILNGDAGADFLDGGLGNDTLSGGLGEDIIVGRFGNDILNGGDGADTLYGSSGSDTLNGNAGNDILYGGTDLDIFIFSDGADQIMDFSKAEGDVIDISSFTSISNLSQLQSSHSQVGADSQFDFGGGNILTVKNMTWAQFSSGDFVFASSAEVIDTGKSPSAAEALYQNMANQPQDAHFDFSLLPETSTNAADMVSQNTFSSGAGMETGPSSILDDQSMNIVYDYIDDHAHVTSLEHVDHFWGA